MLKQAIWRGHLIEERAGAWHFVDTNKMVSETWKERGCGHCGRQDTAEGHDGCLGQIPGVRNACCGHGDVGGAYVQLDVTGSPTMRGRTALRWLERRGMRGRPTDTELAPDAAQAVAAQQAGGVDERSIEGRLLHFAAQLARGVFHPSGHPEDYPKGTGRVKFAAIAAECSDRVRGQIPVLKEACRRIVDLKVDRQAARDEMQYLRDALDAERRWNAKRQDNFKRMGRALDGIREKRDTGEPARPDHVEVERLVARVAELEEAHRAAQVCYDNLEAAQLHSQDLMEDQERLATMLEPRGGLKHSAVVDRVRRVLRTKERLQDFAARMLAQIGQACPDCRVIRQGTLSAASKRLGVSIEVVAAARYSRSYCASCTQLSYEAQALGVEVRPWAPE